MQSIVVDNTFLVVLNFSALNRQKIHLDRNGTSAGYLQPLVIEAKYLTSLIAEGSEVQIFTGIQ